MSINPIVRAVVMYLLLLIPIRIIGKHSLARVTTFDFAFMLIIIEVTQQPMLGDDFSVTSGLILITGFAAIGYLVSKIKLRFTHFNKIMESTPLIVVENGYFLMERIRMCSIDKDYIMQEARQSHGIERAEEIAYAILEIDGSISIVPKE